MDPTSSAPEQYMNGTNGEVAAMEPEMIAEVSAAVEVEAPAPPPAAVQSPINYEDSFPALGGSAGAHPSMNNSGPRIPVAPVGWSRKPVLQPTTQSRRFEIPRTERRANGDASGSGFGVNDSKTLKNVMDKTGCKIEMSSSKDQTLTFLITGSEAEFRKAKAELTAQFQTQTQQTVSIPKEHHRFILGKGGERLQRLESETATKISLPKANEDVNEITITGPRDGIEMAIHKINEVSFEQGSKAYEVLTVSKVYHPIFRNGEHADKFRTEFPNVKINIPPISIEKDEITVAGEKEAVLKVTEYIKKSVKDMEKKFDEVVVQVKKSKHKYVIGKKGETINQILVEFGVVVEMPSSESDSETVTLRGPQDKLPFALTKVYEKANSMVTHEIKCPTWLHKYIIGKKGKGIQDVCEGASSTHVAFLDEGDLIKIDGPPEEADKIRDSLEKQAEDLKANMEYVEITVDAKYHKHIIGKGGSTVNRLKQGGDVQINIPDVDKGNAVIRIEGNKSGVQAAHAELEGMVSKMQNEKEKDLVIEHRFHRQLIGPKGETIQQIRDSYASVQISFPDVGSKSEIVKLRGPKQDVDKCAVEIQKRYKDLLESNYQVKVHIFKQFHKFIIGKAGATINQIRQNTNTKIDLPETGSDSDMITITGKKADVEKARDEVQKIQQEKANVVSIEVKIPANIHNTIIGAGGKIIQSIMDDCGGVHIKFPEAKSGSDMVTVRGPKEDVEKAKGQLESLSTEKQLTSMSAEVKAKPEHHKFLIGVKGANIKSVREETGARIIFPTEKDTDKETITILGTKEAVAQAKKELEIRIKALDNVTEETMIVSQVHHKHFTNKRGEILRQIGEEFGGVTISFPRFGKDSDEVTLKGAKDCIAGARARIEEMVEDLVNQVTIECVIEQKHHRSVMGIRGSNVQRICKDFDVQIKIPEKRVQQNGDMNGGGEGAPVENGGDNSGSDIIRISGKKEKCEAAAAALQELVPVNLEVEVPFEYHRFIIGQKGEGVRELMNRFNVNIKVPNSEAQSSTVVVTGTAASVAEAKVGLEERMEEIKAKMADDEAKSFEIKVSVNPEYHPKIIGRRGAVVNGLRKDHDVNIQLPKQGAMEQDVITIKGYEANAEAAKAAILKIVNQYESMIKEEVEIDNRIHKYIIGRRGDEIKKIQKKFNVELRLPRDGDPNPDLVTIMGDEDGVLDCKDELLNIQEEYLQDEIDRESLQKLAPTRAREAEKEKKANNNSKGFEVKGAPWQGASDDAFPTLGGGGGAAASTPVWGPRR